MDTNAAFDKLTKIQKTNVNREMFDMAYRCVTMSRDPEALKRIISEETEDRPHLRADLERYCKLVSKIR